MTSDRRCVHRILFEVRLPRLVEERMKPGGFVRSRRGKGEERNQDEERQSELHDG